LIILSVPVDTASMFCQTRPDSIATLMNEGYARISSEPARAIQLFLEVARIDPSNVSARRQLGYLLASAGKHEAALEEFGAAEALVSSDSIQLQMAYSLFAIGEKERAKSLLFTLGTTSRYADIREASSDALNATLGYEDGPMAQWGHVYASPYYDSRWKSFFGFFSAHRGFYITSGKWLSGFGTLQLTGDTKTRGGTLPEIFSDNAVIAALGLRLKPLESLSLDVQQGIAYDLVQNGERKRIRGDFRAIGVFGTGLYPDWPQDEDARFPFTPLFDCYSSIGYYSRFDNVIGYLQMKGGVRCFEADGASIDAYARINAARDGNKEFYNNILEWGGGVRVTPLIGLGVFLDLEYLHGRYYDPGPDLPHDVGYDSFRAFLIFERQF
jgi:hypothetical protein